MSNGPGGITKPTVFISHATTDEPIAAIIKAEIDRIFASGVNVFASSLPGAVRPGADWLKEIRNNLDAATAVAVLITPVSINRPRRPPPGVDANYYAGELRPLPDG